MNLFHVLSTCFIVIVFFIFKSVSIKCWICQSTTDPKCGDPFVNKSFSFYDCNSDPKMPNHPWFKNKTATMCRKTRQKVEGEWQIIRSCAYLGEPGKGTGNENVCNYITENFNVFREVCTCNSKDGCNSSFEIMPSNIILSTITVIVIITFFSYTVGFKL